MKYREEVEEAVRVTLDKVADGILKIDADRFRLVGVQPALRDLITLGVQLGIEAAAARAEDLPCDKLSSHEFRAHAVSEIRDLHPGYVLQVRPS